MCSVLPNPLLRQGFASLCPCQDYSLEVFTRDKDWLFPISAVTFLSTNGIGCIFLNWNLPMLPQEMKRGWLIVNFQPGAHLSPTSLVPSTVETRMKLEYSQTPHTRISSK